MENDRHQESKYRIDNGVLRWRDGGILVLNLLDSGSKEDTDEKIERASNQVVDAWHSNLPDAILMVDGIKNLSATDRDVFRDALNKLSGSSKFLIVNGLREVDVVYQRNYTVCVCSKNEVLRCLNEVVKGNNVRHTNVQYVLIPTYASTYGVARCRTAILNLFFEKYKLPCLKIIVGCNADIVMSISNDAYFKDDIPVLVVNDESEFSKALCSYIRSLKTYLQATDRRSFDRVCKENSIREIYIERLTTELEENAWKITVCNLPSKHSVHELATEMGLAICRGINPWITFLMDSSREIAKSLTADDRYRKNSKILIFPNVAKCEASGAMDLDLFRLYEEEYAAILSKMSRNKDKVFYCIENDRTEENNNGDWREIFQIAEGIMNEANIKRYSAVFPTASIEDKKVASSCPLMGFHHALKKNDAQLAECILKTSALDVYPYIYFNISKHWNGNILKKIGEGSNGKQINAVISKLSNGIVADLFEDDGRPNIKVVSPIQALLVNRLLCSQCEFVKVLWCYDKKNALENALLIWMLTNGILNDNMPQDDNGLINLKRYFEDVIRQLMDNAHLHCSLPHDNPTLSLSHVFKFNRLPRKILTLEWSHKRILSEDRENYDQQICLSPGTTLFVRMAVNDRKRFTYCMIKWWSHPWNKLNFASSLLYFVLFSFGDDSSYQSCILFSIFSFIWCMRLCYLLRAFEFSGMRIAAVNTKLHQLGELHTVTLMSLIGYGLVLASILLSLLGFESWDSFMRMAIAHALQKKSSASIEFFEDSKNATTLNTPKLSISTESAILVCTSVCLIFGGMLLVNYFMTVFRGARISCSPSVRIKGQQATIIDEFLEKVEEQMYSFQKLTITVHHSDESAPTGTKYQASS